MGVHRQLLADVALSQDLHGHALAGGEALAGKRLGSHLGAVVEALLEIAQVDRLALRAELLEGHRLLHVRAAQLAEPHVDRHLAALEVHLALAARASAGALVAAAGGLAEAGALAAADALAAVARAGGRLQVVEADLLFVSHQSSIRTRCWTAWMAPRTVGTSGFSDVLPIR